MLKGIVIAILAYSFLLIPSIVFSMAKSDYAGKSPSMISAMLVLGLLMATLGTTGFIFVWYVNTENAEVHFIEEYGCCPEPRHSRNHDFSKDAPQQE